MQTYLIAHQHQQRVERHWRDADGTWQMQVITGVSMPIPCTGLDLAFDVI